MQRPGKRYALEKETKSLSDKYQYPVREKSRRATKANTNLSEDVLMENVWGSFMIKENDQKYLKVIPKHQRKCVVVLERLNLNEEKNEKSYESDFYASSESDFSAASESDISERNRNVESDSDFSLSAQKDLSKKRKRPAPQKKRKRPTPESGENDYMKMVEAKRLQKMALLKTLKINEIKENLCSSVKALKPKRVYTKKTFTPREKIERSAKEDINFSEDHIWQKHLDEVKETRNANIIKPLPYEFSFKPKLHGFEEDMFRSFSEDFSCSDLKEPKNLSPCFERIKSWNCLKRRFSETRISALSTHPSLHNMLVISGDVRGNIVFWNVVSDTLHSFKSHSRKVTGAKFNPHDPHLFLSSSADGRLSCGDMEKFICETYYEKSGDGCSSFDVLTSATYVVGHFSGLIDIVDSRECGKVKSKFERFAEQRITSVNVHPVDPNLFISSDLCGSIKVWDVRQFDGKYLSSYNISKKATSAYFSPVNGNKVLATFENGQCCSHSFIEKKICMGTQKLFRFKGMAKDTSAQWLPWRPGHFSIICHDPNRIEVYDEETKLFRDTVNSNLGRSVRVAYHPFLPVLASANPNTGSVYFLYDTVLEAYRN